MRIAFVVVSALIIAGSAAAAGGTSIAAAPVIRAGVHESENTATDPTRRGDVGSELSQGCWNDFEYWRLPLKAGDKVSITGNASVAGYHFAVGVFPAGTTDKNVDKMATILNAFPGSHVAHFTARTAGTYPFVIGPNCYNGSDGPFSFVVTVTHAA
jgi:hypothetical protein